MVVVLACCAPGIMMKQLILSLCTLAVVCAMNNVEIRDCQDGSHLPARVDFNPCTSEPCDFKKGETVDVTIYFTANKPSTHLTARVYGIVLGIPVPFGLPQPDGCGPSNISCPLVQGQTYTYHNSFPVLDAYPTIQLIVKWELVGDDGNQVCFTFPMSISS